MKGAAAIAPPPGFHVLRPEPRIEPGAEGAGAPPLVHRGAGRRPEIALTFDDGPSRWTAAIASCFQRHRCAATFFLRGAGIGDWPEAPAALVGGGHEVGNHLWSHPRASELSRAELRAEIERTADAIEAAGGPRPELVRPPYFAAPRAVAAAATGTGTVAVILRSIGTSDWAAGAAEEVVAPVLANVQPGDVVCLHDGISPGEPGGATRDLTVAAVQRLLPALLERGLRPVTVTQLLR